MSAVFASKHPPECCIFIHTSKGGALSDTLYFLVIFHGAIFTRSQTAVIFGDQTISEHFIYLISSCKTNLLKNSQAVKNGVVLHYCSHFLAATFDFIAFFTQFFMVTPFFHSLTVFSLLFCSLYE